MTDLVSFFQGRGIDWWVAVGQWAGILIALGGLVFVLIQVRGLAKQQKLAAKAATSLLYGVVSEAMSRVNNLFYLHPEWVRYFYEGEEAPARDTDLRTQLDMVCELVMDFVDAVVEQKRVLPADIAMDWSTWEAYFRFLYARSPMLQEFVEDNLDFYPDYFLAALGYLVVRERKTGETLSTWTARELNPDEKDPKQLPHVTLAAGILEYEKLPPRGFPWNRTWIISRKAEAVGQEASFPVVVAAVVGTAVDQVKVTWRWSPQSNETAFVREQHVLRCWVLGTMEGTGVKKVEFDLPTGRTTYLMGKRRAAKGTNAFLIPEYRPS
ncbi:MAG: hypothetical protein AUH40_11615 [Chloroflexi bacterium 13_1_40CM_65_17]|nr:MAG: hypothetical protein AUH40_11615 [Chloroflexi bacterium 13_1_40CM_65_17]